MTSAADQLARALAWLEAEAIISEDAALILDGVRAALDGDTARDAFGVTKRELAECERRRCGAALNGYTAASLKQQLLRVSRARGRNAADHWLHRLLAVYGGKVPSQKTLARILGQKFPSFVQRDRQ